MNGGRPIRVAIGRISVGAASGLDARRLADALPAAIGRALSDTGAGPDRMFTPADQAAAQIASIVEARLRDGR